MADIISLQGQEEVVKEIRLFYTTVISYDNKTITSPNGQLSYTLVTNLSTQGRRRIDMKLSYRIDFEPVKKVIQSFVASVTYTSSESGNGIGISEMDQTNTWSRSMPGHSRIALLIPGCSSRRGS